MAVTDIPANDLPEPLQLILKELLGTIAPALEWLSWLVGGLFGLYVIYFLIKLYLDRRRIKILKNVQSDVEYLKEHSLSEKELGQLRVILKKKGNLKRDSKKRKVSKKSLKRKGSSKSKSAKGFKSKKIKK
jgi:hypothetical protein